MRERDRYREREREGGKKERVREREKERERQREREREKEKERGRERDPVASSSKLCAAISARRSICCDCTGDILHVCHSCAFDGNENNFMHRRRCPIRLVNICSFGRQRRDGHISEGDHIVAVGRPPTRAVTLNCRQHRSRDRCCEFMRLAAFAAAAGFSDINLLACQKHRQPNGDELIRSAEETMQVLAVPEKDVDATAYGYETMQEDK